MRPGGALVVAGRGPSAGSSSDGAGSRAWRPDSRA